MPFASVQGDAQDTNEDDACDSGSLSSIDEMVFNKLKIPNRVEAAGSVTPTSSIRKPVNSWQRIAAKLTVVVAMGGTRRRKKKRIAARKAAQIQTHDPVRS